jgi:hypothetical protein
VLDQLSGLDPDVLIDRLELLPAHNILYNSSEEVMSKYALYSMLLKRQISNCITNIQANGKSLSGRVSKLGTVRPRLTCVCTRQHCAFMVNCVVVTKRWKVKQFAPHTCANTTAIVGSDAAKKRTPVQHFPYSARTMAEILIENSSINFPILGVGRGKTRKNLVRQYNKDGAREILQQFLGPYTSLLNDRRLRR